jgi:segregation and condensation protein A
MMERSEILKALITQDIGDSISYYEAILNEVDESIDYPDIFSETVSKIFKLVITGRLDPWSVNISEFKDLFAREIGENFEIAGMLISSAWHVLYEKSIQMMQNAVKDERNEGGNTDDATAEDDNLYSLDDTTIGDMPELKTPILHKEASKITLTEFLVAMKTVYKERKTKTEYEPPDYIENIDEDIIAKSNTDSIEQGIRDTLQKISHYMNPFFVEDYWGNSKPERVNFILYLLFLEKAGDVSMEQEEVFGNIRVTKLF